MAAGKSVRELVTVLSFEIDDKPLKQVESRLDELKSTFSFAGLSIGAAAASLFGFAHFTSKAGDAAAKTAEKLGISTQALQQMEFAAASAADVGTDELRTSLQFLNRNLDEAMTKGGEAAKTFARAGVDLNALKQGGGGALQALGAIADRFKATEDPAAKARLAVEIFGRAGQALIPLLNKGSAGIAELGARATELGAVMSDDLVMQSRAFDDAMKEFSFTMKGLRNLIGGGLLPAMTELVKEFVEFASRERLKIAEEIGGVFRGLVKYVKLLTAFFGRLYQAAKGFVDLAGGLERVASVFGVITAIIVSGKILIGIGRLVGAVLGLASAFTLANLAALAIPLAVGAAIVAIGLIVEDVYGFFTGKDSLLGLLLEQIPSVGAALESVFGPVFNSISGVLFGIFGEGGTLGQAFYNLGALLANVLLLPLRMMLSLVSLVSNGLSKLLPGGAGGFLSKVAGTLSSASDFLSVNTAPTDGGQLTRAGFSAAGTSSQATSISAPITVTVPPGTPPGEVGLRVQSGVSDGLEGILRGADRSFKGAPVY